MGTLAVAAAAIAWGTWVLFLRGAPAPAQWLSVMILTVVGLVWLPAAARRRAARSPASWGLLAVAALTDAANYVCFFGALTRGPIAICVLTHYLAPVIVAMLAPFALREPLGNRTPLALIGALLGLCLLVAGDGGLPRAAVTTAVLGGASAFFYAANTLATKRLFASFSQAEVLSYHSLGAAVVLAATGGAPPSASAFFWKPVTGALLLGAGGGALFYFGLARISAQRAAVLTYLEPLVAALVGAAFFGERLGRMGVAGGALILASGLYVTLEPAPGVRARGAR